MVSKDQLAQMKKGSFVVNVARGGIVHEQDLLNALESDHIAGAAIDTWENEPKIHQPLSANEKVWVSPHIGATTEEAQKLIGETVYHQVVKAIEGDVVDYPVNMPNISVIPNLETKKFTVLAEKLGKLARQVVTFNTKEIKMVYRGKMVGSDNSLVRLGFLKGFLTGVVDEFVSFVNVEDITKKSAITVTEVVDPQFTGYDSAVKFELISTQQEKLIVGGTVFQDKFLRLSLIDGFYFEVEPQGDFLVVKNRDQPGVIGELGTFLAAEGINIGSFDLSRNKPGGCLLYTSPSPRDKRQSRMPSSA